MLIHFQKLYFAVKTYISAFCMTGKTVYTQITDELMIMLIEAFCLKFDSIEVFLYFYLQWIKSIPSFIFQQQINSTTLNRIRPTANTVVKEAKNLFGESGSRLW